MKKQIQLILEAKNVHSLYSAIREYDFWYHWITRQEYRDSLKYLPQYKRAKYVFDSECTKAEIAYSSIAISIIGWRDSFMSQLNIAYAEAYPDELDDEIDTVADLVGPIY